MNSGRVFSFYVDAHCSACALLNALIHLVRHASHAELGNVLSGRSDIGLSAAGQEEAVRVGKALAPRSPRAIHSSPRRRAVETAHAIASCVKADIHVVDALDEIDFGTWAGARFATLAEDAAWQNWNRARASAKPPGGETMVEVVERGVRHIDSCTALDHGPFVFVSHGDVIRGLIAHYLGLPLDRMLSFDVGPASISTVAVGDWGGRVVSINEQAT